MSEKQLVLEDIKHYLLTTASFEREVVDSLILRD